MKPIVCFDLDETLLHHTSAASYIPQSAMEALERMRGTCYLVLATGRDMDTHYSRQYRDMVKPDAIIHSNGMKITVGDEMLLDAYMEPELVKRVLAFAEEHNLAVGVTVKDDDYYTNWQQVYDLEVERWGQCGRHFVDPWKLLDIRVRALAYVGKPEGVRLMEQAFPELRMPMFGGFSGADIVERKNSKANGLRLLCRYFGTDIACTYAFGDSMNDYEIIQAAGTGIAMGNAVEELKAVADYVTADICDGGVYKACRHFGLIPSEEDGRSGE